MICARAHHHYSPPDFDHSGQSKKHKHLSLLNGIALLLVTEGTSDVAAATLTNHIEKDMIVSKHVVTNRECSMSENLYY